MRLGFFRKEYVYAGEKLKLIKNIFNSEILKRKKILRQLLEKIKEKEKELDSFINTLLDEGKS